MEKMQVKECGSSFSTPNPNDDNFPINDRQTETGIVISPKPSVI